MALLPLLYAALPLLPASYEASTWAGLQAARVGRCAGTS